MDPAALLHGLAWALDEGTYTIAPGVALGRVERSAVGNAYRRLCRSRHVDDGDPLGFEVFISISEESSLLERGAHFADAANPFCRIANLLAGATRAPITYARMIWPKKTTWPGDATHLLWSTSEWTFRFENDRHFPKITQELAGRIKQMWAGAVTAAQSTSVRTGRLNTALDYFQNSWRSQQLEQACLHLSVAMEVLFAPHTHSETTHQIAFNLAHFLEDAPEDRESLYEVVRRFYAVRSTIIHGGTADERKLEAAVFEMFGRLAVAFERILASPQTAQLFESDTARRQLFRRFLFG